jgi:hypothetical protein
MKLGKGKRRREGMQRSENQVRGEDLIRLSATTTPQEQAQTKRPEAFRKNFPKTIFALIFPRPDVKNWTLTSLFEIDGLEVRMPSY